MARQYASKEQYLRTQTSKRLMSFASNPQSPNYNASINILKERIAKEHKKAQKVNKQIYEDFGYMQKIHTPNLSNKDNIASEFLRVKEENEALKREYEQTKIGADIIFKGDDKHDPIIKQYYDDAIRKLTDQGLTKKEAIAQLEKEGWTKENMKKMASEVYKANRYNMPPSDPEEIINNILESHQGRIKQGTVVLNKKDTSEFR